MAKKSLDDILKEIEDFKGKPTVDATSPLDVKVLPKDIRAATQRHPCECAIAQRLKKLPGVQSVRVGAEVVLVEYKDKKVRYVLAPEDKKRVRDFDIANYFRPDTYQLVPPPAHRKLGKRKGTKSGSNTRTGKARTVYNAPPLRHALQPPTE